MRSSFIKLEGAMEFALISNSCLVYASSFTTITSFHGFRGEKLYGKDVDAVNRNHFSARCYDYQSLQNSIK